MFCDPPTLKQLGQALDEVRSVLMADPARWLHSDPDAETVDLKDWFIPQLYQTGPDPAFIVRGSELAEILQSLAQEAAKV